MTLQDLLTSRSRLRLITLFLLVASLSNASQAQSCQAMVSDLMTWANFGNHDIEFQLVMITSPMKSSQYTVGKLYYQPSRQTGRVFTAARLQGSGTQSFSDRTWSFPGGVGLPISYPFDPQNTDQLQVSLSSLGASPPKLTFTLSSRGDTISSSTPQCGNGFMYGFLQGSMYTFSFNKGSDNVTGHK
jgi:hypothetical protein